MDSAYFNFKIYSDSKVLENMLEKIEFFEDGRRRNVSKDIFISVLEFTLKV